MTFLEKLKSLTRWNRRRIDVFLFRIHRDRVLIVAFNIVLLLFNAFWRFKIMLLAQADKLRGGEGSERQQMLAGFSIPENMPPQVLDESLRVLLIVEDSIPQCFVYRVKQKLEMLALLGMKAQWVSWRSLADSKRLIHSHHIVLFYRVPGFPDVLNIIEYAKSLNKVVIYDLDDLIFDRDRLAEKFRDATGQLSKTEKEAMLAGAKLYQSALAACPIAIASTPALADTMRVHVTGKVYHLANGMDSGLFALSREVPVPRETGFIHIFYGSGTKTHDKDFETIAAPLADILGRFSNVRLVIVGYLTLPESLAPFGEQVTHLPILEFESYLTVLSGADISIAPLEPGIFADCKSEIKWLESAVVGVPSVVTATSTYREAITGGVNGFVAETETDWRDALESLVRDARLRQETAQAARQKVLEEYSMNALSARFGDILQEAVRHGIQQGVVAPRDRGKKRLLLVNTLYPPDAWGGATVVTRNIVDRLRSHYGDRYELYVFTSDIHNPMPYEVREYALDGINVTAVSTPTTPDPDWVYRDEQIAELFSDYLDFRRPDLIHFHSIQHLTASLPEAARRMAIPYFVTVHDAWWISDYQFMLDKQGKLVPELQRNPVVAAATSEDIARTIERNRYLAARLQASEAVFAVSAYQAELYRRNGIEDVRVNRNGVDPAPVIPPRPGKPRLQLGYLGGIARHKGYDLLREACRELLPQNVDLVVVDFDLRHGESRQEQWGKLTVDFVGRFPSEKMADFFALIDILIAPSTWPESFGLITREANLMGRWVVAGRAGGLAEDIVEGISGHIFEMGDTEGLHRILRVINEHPDKYRQPVDVSSLTIRGVAEQVEELVSHYETVLGRSAEAGKSEDAMMSGSH